MKYIFKGLSVLLFLGVCFSYSSSLADPIATDSKLPLFTATSDAFDNPLQVNLSTDTNTNATGFIYNLKGTDASVGLSSLPAGITLFQMSGKNVAVLASQNFSPTTGGDLTLTYLNDGLQDVYQNFNFSIGRQGQSWNSYVLDANGIPQTFTQMYLTAKKVFGKVIGIDHISVQ